MKQRWTILFLLAFRLFAQNPGGSVSEAAARVIAGVEQSAGGSATPVQKLAIDLSFSEPLGRRAAAWGDLRLSSLPREIQSTVTTLPADAAKLVATIPLSELVRSGEFLAGASYLLSGGADSWSRVLLIASVGAATAMAPAQNRFLRQYYGGLRVQSAQQTHTVDVTLGQNEAVTGGRFAGTVMRFDGSYALPLSNGRFAYLFGTAIVHVQPAHTGASPGSDIYRIGVGLDFFQLLKALRSN